jgi:hypothetical protein
VENTNRLRDGCAGDEREESEGGDNSIGSSGSPSRREPELLLEFLARIERLVELEKKVA